MHLKKLCQKNRNFFNIYVCIFLKSSRNYGFLYPENANSNKIFFTFTVHTVYTVVHFWPHYGIFKTAQVHMFAMAQVLKTLFYKKNVLEFLSQYENVKFPTIFKLLVKISSP
jgi:hypothetical protein